MPSVVCMFVALFHQTILFPSTFPEGEWQGLKPLELPPLGALSLMKVLCYRPVLEPPGSLQEYYKIFHKEKAIQSLQSVFLCYKELCKTGSLHSFPQHPLKLTPAVSSVL